MLDRLAKIEPITRSADLKAVCDRLAQADYVTVDTEFLRESTFWSKLCLIQIAAPGEAHIIDPLSDGIDLAPFYNLMRNRDVLKIFHAARQDIEIFVHQNGAVPTPVFDSQIAAMVCGFGDQISYDQLVYRITGNHIDKSSRFTDWSHRPLSDRQLSYALSDVVHLRDVYVALKANLEEQNRAHWLAEEMAVVDDIETYRTHPENAWKRLKMRVKKPRQLAVMQAMAAWRECEAQSRNIPRRRVVKDEAIYELALQQPKDRDALARLRAVPRGFERSPAADGVLEAVAAGLAVDNGVASRIIATVDDLEKIACDNNADVAALRGWRRELFGEKALALKRGELALALSGNGVTTINIVSLKPDRG
jgi:ribonuclease D